MTLCNGRVRSWRVAEAPPADAAQVLDAALADRSFLAAERLTLADVACYVACKQAVAGASCRNAARWLRQVQAECRRLAPKAAWPELVSVGPQNVAGPLAASNTAAPKAKPPPKQPEKPKAAPTDTKKKEKKPKAPKPAKAPPAPSMPEPSSAVWKSTSASVHIHVSAMVRPSWLGRAVRNEHHHAIEQASRRWRGGRRDDSAQGRQDILIYAQAMSDWLMTFISVVSLVFLFSVKKLRDDLRKELRGHAATGVFLFLLFAATVVLSVSAMRKLSKRVVTESTDIFDHEV